MFYCELSVEPLQAGPHVSLSSSSLVFLLCSWAQAQENNRSKQRGSISTPWGLPTERWFHLCLGSILYKTANSICYTLSYPHTAVFHALKEDFQWTNSKGRSCDNKHTAVCRQTLYARVTFTVLSTPTQILQAATELPLQSIHLFHVPLSDLGAREHPDTSSSGTQMSALIPNMRTLCMFGSFATTSTKTARVLRKNIGCL